MMQVAIMKGRRVGVREVSILELLDWAFRKEKVSIEFDAMRSVMPGQMPGFGMEWVMIERARLGCRVDGGGTSPCHPDADAVADALAQLPEACGGRSMAITIAELARVGEQHGWAEGCTMKVAPRAWRQTYKGPFAETEVAMSWRYESRGRQREVQARWCPIVVHNQPAETARARRAYLQWWSALRELRDTFRNYGGLCSHQVTAELPPMKPWATS
ncbi:MAG: hypothetical protein GYB53_11555 [Rhodobacteraceae bacterium]|nr:hypothetical protein [Paracoccaceae bacterium]MBR9820732.1 hypothetical protein [Paracoccaceae bacterium]